MDKRIKELIDFTKTKFGLDSYSLERYSLYRNVNIFNNTVYILGMEWFPNHIIEQEDDDLNPEGTAVIDIDVHSRKFESVIFVGGKSYADGINFYNYDTKDIIQWVERETGLVYGKQFQLYKEKGGEFQFEECFDGVAISNSGPFEMKFDQAGNLTFFAAHGQYPSKAMIKEETYMLSLEKVAHIAKEQLKLIEFPSDEQERLCPIYAVEEIYVTNEQMLTIPVEMNPNGRTYLEFDQIIYWDSPSTVNKPFARQDIDWMEDVTVDQAFSCEPSPDSFPITEKEKVKCVKEVKDVLRLEYPNDSGQWILKTLHREKGYIFAILRANKHDSRLFQRKLNVVMDDESLQVINFIDNKPMLEVFDHFQEAEKVTITKKEAYEKVKGFMELKPYYVYDFEQCQYVLCGMLDCQYGVSASNGEVIALDNL